jgi:MFS family permease
VTTAAGVFSRQYRAMTIGIIMMIGLVAFEGLATATVLPAAERELGGLRWYAWSFSAFLLAGIVGLAVAGGEADRRGPAAPFAAGLVLFSAGLLVAGLAPAMWVLVAGRAVQGLGAAFIPITVYVTVGRAYPEALRPRMFALFASAWVVPALVGPSVAGALAEYVSWRAAFLGILPLVVLAGWMTLPALRGLDRPAGGQKPGRERERRSLGLAVGATLVLWGVSSGNVVAGVGLVVLGALVGLRPLLGLLPAGTLRLARGLPAVVAGMGIINVAFMGADSFVPYALINLRDQSSLVAGLVITTAALSWTGGAWIVERYAERFSRRAFVMVGMGHLALGTLLLVGLPWSGFPVWMVVVAWLIAGMGMGLAYPNFGLITLSEAKAGSEGEATSALKLAEWLGNAAGAGVAGAIVAAGTANGMQAEAVSVNFGLMAALAVFGMVMAARMPGGEAELDVPQVAPATEEPAPAM